MRGMSFSRWTGKPGRDDDGVVGSHFAYNRTQDYRAHRPDAAAAQPMSEIAPLVIAAARKRLLFLPHAVRQMSRPDRMISAQEVRRVVLRGAVIEDYPEDARGHSCLMSGTGDAGRKIHVVCSPRDEYLAIITAYVPEADEWDEEFRVRRPS
jgi:hypothetical protein